MDSEQYIEFITLCLKDFDYPNIQGLEKQQFFDIFSTANRVFLIKWILKKMNPAWGDILEGKDLRQIINLHGFCNKNECKPFIDGGMPNEEQLKILYRMCKHLKAVNADDAENRAEASVPISEVQRVLAFDTNLYPSYGPKKTLTDEEREVKIADYQQEIAQLKAYLETQEDEPPTTIPDSLKQQLEALDKTSLNLPEFRSKVLKIMQRRNFFTKTESEEVKSDEQQAETLKMMEEDVDALLAFIKSVNGMSSSDGNQENLTFSNSEKERAMLRQLSEIITEISNL